MPIEYGFILAAGYGTRMGEIGIVLPKVLWPLFDSTLLGLQIYFLQELGVKNIYLNTHHQSELVEKYCRREFPDVHILKEAIILDAGGGVHNFINKVHPSTPFLIINSDQFLKTDLNVLKSSLFLNTGVRAKIFTMKGSSDYSTIVSRDGFLSEISQNAGEQMFSGLTLLSPDGLKKSEGPSKYFESVCNYKKEKIQTESLMGDFLDFGETHKFYRSAYELLSFFMKNKGELANSYFHHLINKDKIINESYNTEQWRVLNFSKKILKHNYPKGSIVLKESEKIQSGKHASIYYDGIAVEVS